MVCGGCGTEVAETDRFCSVCGRPVVPPGVDEIVLGPEGQVEERPSVRQAPSAAIAGTLVLLLAVVGAWALLFSGETTPIRPGTDSDALDAPAPTAGSGLSERSNERLPPSAFIDQPDRVDVSMLGDTGATHLALRDDFGLRWIDLATGRITVISDGAHVIRPIEPLTGSVLVFDQDEPRILAQTPSGPAWSVEPTGTRILRTHGDEYWQVRANGTLVLTRHVGSAPGPVETIVLPFTGRVLGFHDGRPVTHVRGVIAVISSSGNQGRVATGVPIAQADRWLVYRPCKVGSGLCTSPPVRLDLETGEETILDAVGSLARFGHWGNSLSPDGRWLVSLDYAEPSGDQIGLVELDTGRRIPIHIGLLGYGGRTGSFEWSPNASVLVAPGSDRLMLFDVETESVILLPLRMVGDVPSLAWVETVTPGR